MYCSEDFPLYMGWATQHLRGRYSIECMLKATAVQWRPSHCILQHNNFGGTNFDGHTRPCLSAKTHCHAAWTPLLRVYTCGRAFQLCMGKNNMALIIIIMSSIENTSNSSHSWGKKLTDNKRELSNHPAGSCCSSNIACWHQNIVFLGGRVKWMAWQQHPLGNPSSLSCPLAP